MVMKTDQGNVSAHKPFISQSPIHRICSIFLHYRPDVTPVCAAPVSFPSDTLLLPLVSLENDQTGTKAELSVPHATSRKLPSFHSSGSISFSHSKAVVYACSFTENHGRPFQFFSAPYIHLCHLFRLYQGHGNNEV